MAKKRIFWFHVLADGSVALWGGATRQKSCSPGLIIKLVEFTEKTIPDAGPLYIYLRNPQNRDF